LNVIKNKNFTEKERPILYRRDKYLDQAFLLSLVFHCVISKHKINVNVVYLNLKVEGCSTTTSLWGKKQSFSCKVVERAKELYPELPIWVQRVNTSVTQACVAHMHQGD
jgi:hypothetical protein